MRRARSPAATTSTTEDDCEDLRLDDEDEEDSCGAAEGDDEDGVQHPQSTGVEPKVVCGKQNNTAALCSSRQGALGIGHCGLSTAEAATTLDFDWGLSAAYGCKADKPTKG